MSSRTTSPRLYPSDYPRGQKFADRIDCTACKAPLAMRVTTAFGNGMAAHTMRIGTECDQCHVRNWEVLHVPVHVPRPIVIQVPKPEPRPQYICDICDKQTGAVCFKEQWQMCFECRDLFTNTELGEMETDLKTMTFKEVLLKYGIAERGKE